MKKYLLSIALIFFLDIEIKAHVDHYSNYNYLEYELFRNNKLIGYHKYEFQRDGNNLVINNEVNFKITKLGVDLYKYYAKGVEKYENGVFSGFNSNTNQNKKEKFVNITIDPNDKNLIIDGSSFKGKVDKDFIIGTWWNHEIVQKKAQISAVSGRIIKQKLNLKEKKKLKLMIKFIRLYVLILVHQILVYQKIKNLIQTSGMKREPIYGLKAAFEKTGYWEYRLKKVK